jgi:hypothetical protein
MREFLGARGFTPFKIGVGTQNIRASTNSLHGDLGRQARESFKEIEANFKAYTDHLEEVIPEVLKWAMEDTFEKSRTYCPKDTGRLVDSGYLEVEKFKDGSRCELGYGRGGTPHYAIVVHEVPMAHIEPTRYKWLEAAIDEDYYQILQKITDGMKQAGGV